MGCHFLLCPFLNPSQPYSVLHDYRFVVSRILHTWNYAVFSLLGLTCFMHHSSLEIDPDCPVYQQQFFSIIRWIYYCVSIVPFYWCVVFQGGEGNGTPLQYSCLENPTDRGAWWAAVRGVAQSRTRLKRLSSSSSSSVPRGVQW